MSKKQSNERAIVQLSEIPTQVGTASTSTPKRSRIVKPTSTRSVTESRRSNDLEEPLEEPATVDTFNSMIGAVTSEPTGAEEPLGEPEMVDTFTSRIDAVTSEPVGAEESTQGASGLCCLR
jgi:hypothetical protein